MAGGFATSQWKCDPNDSRQAVGWLRAQVRDEIERTKSNSEKLLDSLRASMEECDVRIEIGRASCRERV